MKILLTMNLPYTRSHGGTNRSNRSLAEGLAARGHHVRALVPALAVPSSVTHAQLLEELRADGLRVRTEGGLDRFELNGVEVHAVVEPSRLRASLVEAVGEFGPDWTLVSAEDQSQNLLDAALGACPPGRVVYLAHTPQMFPFGPASLYPGEARTQLVGRAAAVVTISEFVADYVRRWTGFEAFVNHPPHFGAGPFPQLARHDGGYVLLMNACAVKGISVFLALADAFPGTPFAALPGYGTTDADRAALAARPNVTVLRNEKHLDDIFRQTRVLLMPSLWVEGFGMAVVDAMLRGIPVLASNFGGLVEAKLGTDYLLPVRPIEQFEERLEENMLPAPVVPPQEIGPWRDALGELLSDRALYERQSAAAREASHKFISGLSVAPFEELLERLAERPAAAHSAAADSAAPQGTNAPEADPLGDLSDLTPEQQELLQLWLRQELAGQEEEATEPESIPRAPRGGEIPLSFTQQRLWFLESLEPGTPLYNVPAAVRLKGRLDVDALGRALREVVRRHESLRTTFAEVEGRPTQVISDDVSFDLSLEDLSALDDVGREEQVRRLVADEARRPFDLSAGPLLRARIVKLAAEEHVVALVMHHIISDGWSVGVLVQELGALYGAFTKGQPSPLAELPIQYADYAIWQRDYLSGQVLDAQLAYWRERLAGVSVLELPAERPRPAARTHAGATYSFAVPADVADGLKELGLREGVTSFMTLLAAFQVLLSRYTNQEDIAVGTPIAGRQRAEVEGLIGFFVNTLVVRTDLSGGPTFRELLGRVRESVLGAFSHQDVPFERLVEELQPERSGRHQPLFQVAFALQNAARETLELPGLFATPEPPPTELSKFDLTLGVQETEGALGVTLEYSTDLFDAAAAERMAGHFTTLLKSIAARPDERITRLPILTEAERRRLLVAFNDTRADYPAGLCVHQLFERQAAETPDAVAVVFDDETLTYAELNSRANRLARRLREHGVRPESRVGVCAERSAGMVVALLGVLKAGGAYVPLDPSYPSERLAFMLEDAGVRVLLAQERLVGELPDHDARLVCLDAGREEFAAEDETNLDNVAAPDNLAYVIYTSGSTGRPKGVCVT
ncbi:MAG TPA: condensation domain-containing protein, partial [Pyrinomonadaceae bacterium]